MYSIVLTVSVLLYIGEFESSAYWSNNPLSCVNSTVPKYRRLSRATSAPHVNAALTC